MAPKNLFDSLHPCARTFIAGTTFLICYYVSAKLGLTLSFAPDYIAALWPPNAIIVSTLVLTKPKSWWYYLILMVPAELAADIPAGISCPMALRFVGADFIEALIAAILLRRFIKGPILFNSLRQTISFIVCCVLIAPFVAAFPGALVSGFEQSFMEYLENWQRWFMGDALTHLTFTPFIILCLNWKNPDKIPGQIYYYFELAVLGMLLILASIVSLGNDASRIFPALFYAPLPFLLWAAVRFGPGGIFSASLFVSLVTIWNASMGKGPFTAMSAVENIVNLQVYLFMVLTPLILLSAIMTERMNVERALSESEATNKALLEALPDSIFRLDKDGTYKDFIPAEDFKTIVPPNFIIGKRQDDMLPPELSQKAKHHFDQLLKTGEMQIFDYPLTLNNETRHYEARLKMIDENEILGIVRDNTEIRRTQELMVQTEKMLSVGGLAAGMAHEINNPLAGILQNLQVLRTRMSGELPKNRKIAEECGTSIEAIEAYMAKRGLSNTMASVIESGQRAAQIVNNMLSISRNSDASFAMHDLGELLDKTVNLASTDFDLKKEYDFRQIEIVREYGTTTPKVFCDGSKIQQVFLNLLKNGTQAMAGNNNSGKSPRFTLWTMADGDMVRIEIEDNGPGMDEETRKRVFEPFFTTKGVSAGTGLGLSVSYFIITENHGGTMTVESVPGKYTKFIIKLPLDKSAH